MFQALSSENFTPKGTNKVMSTGNRKMVAQECTDFLVYDTIVWGCSIGGHMVGDNACEWNNGVAVPPGEQKAGSKIVLVSITVCFTNNFPAPEPGGNSGGGGTSPTPPGDYDPCKDAVPTAAYVNNNSGLKLAVVPPSPCDEGGGGKLPIIDDETPSQFAIELQLFINELQISDASLVSFLANNKNVFNTLNNYLITNGKTVANKEFVEWAAGYINANPNKIRDYVTINPTHGKIVMSAFKDIKNNALTWGEFETLSVLFQNQSYRPRDREPASYTWRPILNENTIGNYLTIPEPWEIINNNGDFIPNTAVYNCHYHSFGPNYILATRLGYPKYVDNVDLTKFSKVTSNIQVGDIVVYFVPNQKNTGVAVQHSAIVTEVDFDGYATKVGSKMGIYQILEHHPRDIPMNYGTNEDTITVKENTYPSRIYFRKKP